MSRQVKIILDCTDHHALARFWAAALQYQVIGSADPYTVLRSDDGGPELLLQQVAEPKQGKNRVHFDVICADIDGEARRLEALGAKRTSGLVSEHGHSWIVMADPEGNEFCVCDGGPSH